MGQKRNLNDFIEIMASSQARDKIGWLLSLAMKPSGDPRFLPYLEANLDDTSLCVIGAPTRYGEIRFLVAQALYAEYRKQGVKRFIILHGVVHPIDSNDYTRLRMENNLSHPENVDMQTSRIMVLEELRRLGKLPIGDVELNTLE